MDRYFRAVKDYFATKNYEFVEECIVCGRKTGITPPYYRQMIIAKCSTCGFTWSVKQPTQAVLDEFYKESEPMALWAKIKESKKEGVRQTKKFKKLVGWIRDNKVKSVIDIGCGNGKLLEEINALKMDIRNKGFEPNKAARDEAIARGHGVDAELFKYGSQYAMLTATGVLEHVKDPKDFINTHNVTLEDGGYFGIIVPNVDSLVVQYLGEEAATFCPQHLWYFNIETLTELMKQCGFTLDSYWTEESELEPIKKVRAGLPPYAKLNGLKIKDYLFNEQKILGNNLGYKLVAVFKKEEIK